MEQQVMNNISYGLFILTAYENGKDNGCIINTAAQVTAEPNRILITVNKTNLTHDMIERTKKFTVSTISENADFALFKRFGFSSGHNTDKFEGFNGFERGENGINYITDGTNSCIMASVYKTVDLGTHTIFIASVDGTRLLNDTPSATYAYYHANIKPKPQDTGKNENGKTVWRCTICGYEYVGEELPEDFICPLCKHPASDFVKVV